MKADMSCVRVKTYTSSKISPVERHNERKNKDYGNVNVDISRTPMNIHFKDPGERSYAEIVKEMEENGMISRRGLRADAAIYDEMIFDVNTMYFERKGGYEYAKGFYHEAYQYAVEKYGEENILSAVMHADEINKAATEEAGHPVYHYHMHLIALPVVDKEIRWSKRCKDRELVGKVKQVIKQISHSKKWESRKPVLDDNGNPVMKENGKIKFRPSYSILQDEFYEHMVAKGFEGFIRGNEGSTSEHLTSLQYQIMKDQERLSEIQDNIRKAELQYEPAKEVRKTYKEIENSGKKNRLTGNYTLQKEDLDQLTALAKEGITSRAEINGLKERVRDYRDKVYRMNEEIDYLKNENDELYHMCGPFLYAMEKFPETARTFMETVREFEEEKSIKRSRDNDMER